MKMWPLLVIFVLGGNFTLCKLYQHWEREMKWKEAEEYSNKTRKPLLNIGCGNNPRFVGDVNVDIVEGVILPNYCQVDLNKPLPWKDKEFGAATAFHILEHMDDPKSTLRELQRVADRVYVAVPLPFDIHSYFVPSHKWFFVGGPEPVKINGASNLTIASAVGLGLGLVYVSTRGI